MALSRKDIDRLLDSKCNSGQKLGLADAKRRQAAQQRARYDALTALAKLHPEEYRALYEVAVERQLKQAGF